MVNQFPPKLAFAIAIVIFVIVSLGLYNNVDTNARYLRAQYKNGEIDSLKRQISELEDTVIKNQKYIKEVEDKLAKPPPPPPQYEHNVPPVPPPKDNAPLNGGEVEEANKSGEKDERQIPEPDQKVPIIQKKVTLVPSKATLKEIINFDWKFTCPNRNAVSNVQMLSAYEEIPFDNVDGGVWKQGWEISYDKNKITSEKKLEVVVIPHSHCDPGWIKTFENYYIEQVKNILDGMAKHLPQKKEMKFIYAEMSFFERWWTEQSEEVKETVRGLLKSGQFEIVTGGWVMPDEANPNIFPLVMQLFEGHEFLQNQVQFKPRNTWSIDPFGMSSIFAQLAKSSNMTHMVLQRIHYSVKKYLAKKKHLEFRWRQLYAGDNAKTDIRAHMFPFYSYDVSHTCGPDPSVCCQFDFRRLSAFGCPWGKPPKRITDKNVAARAEILADQYRKKAQLYKLNTLLVPLGDDFRYDTDFEWNDQYDNYKLLFDYMNSKSELNIHARFGTLKDYFEILDQRLEEETDPKDKDLPVLSGDFFTYSDRDDHYWSGYFTSRPFYKHMDRTLSHYVRSADILFSLARWKSAKSGELFPSNNIYDKLVEARRTMSLFQHHDAVVGTSKSFVMIDYAERLVKAINNCKNVISFASGYILGMANAKAGHELKVDEEYFIDKLVKKQITEDGSTVINTNTLAYDRTEVNCVRVSSPKTRIRSADSTEPLQQVQPVVFVNNGRFEVAKDEYDLCYQSKIPAFGFARYEVFEAVDSSNLVKIEVVNKSDLNLFEQAETFSGSELKFDNGHLTASFDVNTGLLKTVQLKNDKVLEMSLEFVHYGARGKTPGRDPGGDSLSGAYLFLPDGPAKSVVAAEKAWIKFTGPVRQSIISKPQTTPQIQHVVYLDVAKDYLEIVNEVDIRPTSNYELGMRFKSSDFAENDQFFTDLSGVQMIKRKRFEKLPFFAQFYPMPAAAFIQSTDRKWTLLGRQPLGVASLQPGWFEVMLDRRLDQDDDLGMGEDVHDNRLTESRFRVLVEQSKQSSTAESDRLGFHSIKAHHLSSELHFPINNLVTSLDSLASKELPLTWTALKQNLPCDIHVLNLRTYSEPTKYSSDQTKTTAPKREIALILQRFGVECQSPQGQEEFVNEKKCQPTSGQLDLNEYLQEQAKSFTPTSLTSLDSGSPSSQLQIDPFDLRTVKIEF